MRSRGFTLIEIIATLLVVSILAGTVLFFIRGPVTGFFAQSRRAQLVSSANAALDRMVNDIRGALPNSVRTGSSGKVLQLIPIVDAGRYRVGPSPTYPTPPDRLQFNHADSAFNIESSLDQLPNYPTSNFSSTTDRLVVYNTGQPGDNAYTEAPTATTGVITTQGDTITVTQVGGSPNQENNVTLGTGFQFKYQSPGQRIYLVDGTVAWLCKANASAPYGTLQRATPAIGSSTPGLSTSGATAVDGATQCSFQYTAGTASRGGLVTITLTLAQGTGTKEEQVHLVRQVHVDNVP